MCGSFCFVIAIKMGVQIVFFIPIQMKGGMRMIVSKLKIVKGGIECHTKISLWFQIESLN